MDYVILVSFIFITVVESRRLDASGFVSPTRNFGRRNGIHGLGINQMNAQLRRTNHRIIIHKIDFHSARIPILKTSTRDESSDENPTIMPTTGASSRRAPRKRITNKYGLIESNDERLPEKSEEKRRREASRFVNRQKKQVEKVNEEIRNNHVMRIGEGDDSFQSLAKVEEMARGKCNGANGDMSQRILINFQSAMEEQKLENLTDELVACKTLNAKGDRIPLSAIILPRDQTSLIRLLGAKGAYTSMLNLLRHLEESMNISGSQYAYTAAITALAQSSNRRWRAQAITLLDEMDEKAIPPNTYTFTATFLAVDGGKAALELLNRAKSSKSKSVEVGIHLYNGAIHACSRNDLNGENGWQTALSLLRTQMPRDGIEPNEQTYTSVIHACAKSGQLKVAMSIFDELRSTRGIPERSANKVWGAILRACATTGDSSKAMELMRDMLSSNVRPNTLHYNSVLSALAKEGNDKMAVELLDRMVAGTVQSFVLDGEKSQTVESDGVVQRTGAMPDLISINTVLTSFVKSENYNGAKQFFRRVKLGEFMYDRLDSRAVIRPDIISYNSLLSVCKDSREAKIIMQEVSFEH
jgi:pentatricopeptide repeat protein